MQTTLLTAAIALILALVAALVGPLLVDWGTYRPLFEAQASRLVGLPVVVKGRIDARLLPSPQLTLHDIEIGGETIRARSLDIELALGALLRGDWRATELRITGPQMRLGLDAAGHLNVPAPAVGFRPESVSVDRLSIQDGRLTLTDAASGAGVTLEQLYFNGAAESLLGPFHGEGDAVVGGEHYPYRIVAGRYAGDRTLNLKINVDPRDRPLNFESAGTLTFEGGAPRFEGALSLARPAGLRAPGGEPVRQPWRLAGKIKAGAAAVLIENVDFLYGAEEHGIKLTGVANLKFGKTPRFEGVLSGRQIDLDGALGGDPMTRSSPGAALRQLAELARGAFRPVIPLQIGIGIDQLTLAGGVVQNLRGDISADAHGWDLKTFEFRAPGFTQARLSGHLALGDAGVTFTGPAEIDSSDPKALAAWLQGRDPSGPGDPRSLHMRGELTLGSEKIALERLSAEFARRTITGRFAYVFAAGGHPSKLDAALNAPELDLDVALGFGRALLAGSALDRPQDMTIAAEIGRATIAGIEGHNLSAQVKVDADRWAIDRLVIGDLGGAALSASGGLTLSGPAPQGDMRLDFDARDMAPVLTLLARFAPGAARALGRSAPEMAPAKLRAQFTLGPAGPAKLALQGSLGKVRLAFNGEGEFDAKRFNVGAMHMQAKLDASDGKALIALLGLHSIVAVDTGAGALTLDASGPARGDWQVDGRLTAAGLDASAGGTVNPFGAAPTAALRLAVARADAAPLRGSATTLPVALATRVALSGNDLSLSEIDASVAGAKLRGRVSVGLAAPHAMQGDLDADSIDASALIAVAIGMPPGVAGKDGGWAWANVPFEGGWLGDFTGALTIKARQFTVLPGLAAREFRGTLRLGKNALAFDDIKGVVSGGRLTGSLDFRNGAEGLVTRGAIALAGADVAALLPAAARPPITGALDLSLTMEGAGRSPQALIGSLHGAGKIALSDAAFAGLDPRAFDAVTRAVDQGLSIDVARISDVVRKALDSGRLSIKHAQGGIVVTAGQARLTDFTAKGADADLSLIGSLDLIDGALDSHLILSGKSGDARPDIFMSLKGPVNAPARNVDVSALTGWLTLRAVENEARRLKAAQDAQAKAAPPPLSGAPPPPPTRAPPLAPPPLAMPPQAVAPALPAPIYVDPLPRPRGPKPEASIGPQR
ncbi:MAG TPA: AsmA-like C-terminal region-containing protein [Pseudolabrys sp.]|nr:AsmA-like C-terminal region-containing protein [Pseudolabrys sp.]